MCPGRIIEGEIAALPQRPDDVAVAGPVVVIELDHPVLVAHARRSGCRLRATRQWNWRASSRYRRLR